jgi:hypothetical protein
MKKLILLALLVSLNAQASIYEDLKSKFEARPAAKLSQLKNLPMKCAMWSSSTSDSAINTDLEAVSYTYPVAGPLYPERTVTLPGFLDAFVFWGRDNPKYYVENYQLQQLSDRIRLATSPSYYSYYIVDFKFDQYLYFKVNFYDPGFGGPFQLSVHYGYCWKN